jgi:uncharacterized protein YndB with AHSA1/START domain
MNEATLPIASVRKPIKVSAPAARAYEIFTRDFGVWWPLSTHSVGIEQARNVAFGDAVGEDIVETMRDGSTQVWGTILVLEPPHRIAFSWHPGRTAEAVTHVEVTFTPDPKGGTVVELTHSGWERWADGETQAAGYRVGWTPVLQAYLDVANGEALRSSR